MLSRIMSIGLTGIKGFAVAVESDVSGGGLPQFEMVGLPDAAVRESRERVRSAIRNSSFSFPQGRITVNLAPADIRKEGAVYDLAIAIGLMTAQSKTGRVPADTAVLGELALSGELRGISGALPMVISAKELAFRNVIIPAANAAECECVEGIGIIAVESLTQLCDILAKKEKPSFVAVRKWDSYSAKARVYPTDMSMIKGQYAAKRAMEIAAAGAHNMLMIGPPGSGKSMLANALPSILPDLTFDEAIEVTKIKSICGSLEKGEGLTLTRPFFAPHHTASTVSLCGGGNPVMPGAITRADNGVLFLDELPEFGRNTLEALRQPVEDGKVVIARANMNIEFPAKFMLIAAMNPCPCGYYGSRKNSCRCSRNSIRAYLNRISGPMIDRFDLHVETAEVDYDKLTQKSESETSEKIRQRVCRAREVAVERLKKDGILTNSQMTSDQVRRHCAMSNAAEKIIRHAFNAAAMSARGYMRLLKIARTIADLEASDIIEEQHMAEAVSYRSMDEKYWGSTQGNAT